MLRGIPTSVLLTKVAVLGRIWPVPTAPAEETTSCCQPDSCQAMASSRGSGQVVMVGPLLEQRLEGQAARGLPEQGRQHAPGAGPWDEGRAERPRVGAGAARTVRPGARRLALPADRTAETGCPTTGADDRLPAAGMIRWRPIRSRSLGFMLLAAASWATVSPSAREMAHRVSPGWTTWIVRAPAAESGRPGADQEPEAGHGHDDRTSPDQPGARPVSALSRGRRAAGRSAWWCHLAGGPGRHSARQRTGGEGA